MTHDEADDMCDNCVTPWKCNGPHVPESLRRGLSQVAEARPRDDLLAPTLPEFLLARIAEDYAAADLVLRPYGDHASTNDAAWWSSERDWFKLGLSSDETPLVTRMTPQRVLAECEAKRHIVTREALILDSRDYVLTGVPEQATWPDVNRREVSQARRTLLALASVYADHPDYREEWKP